MVSAVSKQEFQFMVNSWPEYSAIEAAGKRSDQKNEQINNKEKESLVQQELTKQKTRKTGATR